ncbi:DUF6446 family protein [Donghicola mangrovi]|uniref:DUF6446 family protein n=1 Tax=Donghicola mangrovi TaxID=2729614 RepID=UPI0015A07F03|nr:DUF6446 family protein [Donghicola mangrovi]
MRIGQLIVGGIAVTALAAGALLYYQQVYAYYGPVEAKGTDDVMVTTFASNQPEGILYDDFKAIDADSSPLRYRACFHTPMSQAMMTETYVDYPKAEPLVGPGWFDCFDATAIGNALETGEAVAFLGQRDFIYGIDRVVAVLPDGRGFVWHQMNHCGEVVYDGDPVPEDCPEPPKSVK